MAAAAAMASILKNLRTAAGSEDLERVFVPPVGIPTFYLNDPGVPPIKKSSQCLSSLEPQQQASLELALP
jgi:hypothetical protein